MSAYLRICLLIFLIALSRIAFATDTQDNIPESPAEPVVWAVTVIGNTVTESEFIKREMRIKPGSIATTELLETDRLHLLSLGLFNYVTLRTISDRGRAVVVVTVTEKPYIYPYPILDYDPLNPRRRIFGLRLHHDNFRGYGEHLSFAWWEGYEHGVYLLHRDPWFSIRGLFGIRLMGYTNKREIKDPATATYVRTQTDMALIRIRRRLGYQSWIGIESVWEERSSAAQFYTLSGHRDKIVVNRLMFEGDWRDYAFYPADGLYLACSIESNAMVDTAHTFFRNQIDLRGYKPLERAILAARLTVWNTYNKVPFYRRLELIPDIIRSDEAQSLSGTAMAALNLELRFNILPLRYINLPDWPLVGQYVQHLKFSIEGVTFIDRGWLNRDDVPGHAWFLAYGGGLQFQLPYIEAARAIAGWNPSNKLSSPLIIIATDVTF